MVRRNKGAVLIILLSILAILAFLGVVFVAIAAQERSVSRNYVDAVRARLVAQSGIEDGIQRLDQTLALGAGGFHGKEWRYYGDDLLETGDPLLMSVPLEGARNPSYAREVDDHPLAGSPKPMTVKVGGKRIGFTACAETGTYGVHGDFYSLRVRDLQGAIHVNDGVREPGVVDANGDGEIDSRDSSVSQNLRRILNNLGAIPSVGVAGLGDKIVGSRPAGGYRTLDDLRVVLGNEAFEKVRPFLTARAWTDRDVANPVPLSAQAAPLHPVKYFRGDGSYRYGRNRNSDGALVATPLLFAPPGADGTQNAVFGMDELNPQHIQIVERAPVNVNVAPREVLIALLDGLKGFFLVEKRENDLPLWTSAYQWVNREHTFDTAGSFRGAVGFLYQTLPIVGPGSPGVAGISAETIADHILACREARPTPAFDYSSVWWGGPFRTWRQFNAFCDNLVAIGLVADDREIFRDFDGTEPSKAQRRVASQAIADVLKANFNPNLHLNETNPDANLFTLVDKTDLIVNSTEFCFLPCGLFEIESIGRVVRPVGSDDAWTAGDNEPVAKAKMRAVVKLFDVHRETSQKHFAAGTVSPREALPLSDGDRSLQVGPEPDRGKAPAENEWDGWIALPTVGGTGGALVGKSEMGETLHGHFSGDFLLHYHADGIRDELASKSVAGESVANLPDRTEAGAGPYGASGVHRLARSFRLTVGASLPDLKLRAPLDLRIDGAYSERHSAPAYWLSPKVLGAETGTMQGVLAMWVKPSFLPETSGKPRIWLNMDRSWSSTDTYMNPSPLELVYTASHDAPAGVASPGEMAVPLYNLAGAGFGVQGLRPTSLAFGYGYSAFTRYGAGTIAEGGCVTPSLNHLVHPHAAAKESLLRGHEWVHVVVTWNPRNPDDCSIYVDGALQAGTARAWFSRYVPGSKVDWTLHEDGSRNTLRLGSVSRFRDAKDWGYARNWAADATVDEVYLWNSIDRLDTALALWQQGRYRRPAAAGEGVFTSGEIDLSASPRSLPAGSAAVPPEATGAGPSVAEVVSSPSGVRIVGISWTWFAERADAKGKEILVDRASGTALHPEVGISIVSGAVEHGPYSDAGFSSVSGAEGPFRYRVRFSIPDAQFDSVLLATPVVDDVTVYYRRAGLELESWVVE
ncbi:MAG: hypothetical protein HYY17_08870 [Planctomycetes bacterium]|nr:hypothetical protein [Planctomycetota bacterium]